MFPADSAHRSSDSDAAASTVDHVALAHEAVMLAAHLLRESQKYLRSRDRIQSEKMARLMDDPNGKALTLSLADQVFRAHAPARSASQFTHLIHKYGVPGYLSLFERQLMRVGSVFAPHFPGMVMPAVTENLRKQSAQVILPAEPALLDRHISRRRATGTRLNINQLGEAILGEEEANKRLRANLSLLERPEIEYISIKISSIFSQLNPLAFEDTVREVQKRLRLLYRHAQRHLYKRSDGSLALKFVNLDMEEYRDLHLTAAAFQRTLMEPEFLRFKAAIVLQAYLPDSWAILRELADWARARIAAGGASVKVRIVKGANLAMERIDAASHGWPQAPYQTKAEVDANYKRMLHFGCRPGNARAINLGIASHNLFDLAYALVLRRVHGVESMVEVEMLEGMANHQAAAVQHAAGGLLLYAPIVAKGDFHSAIAYLIRRLDENTAAENFLHDLFRLEVDSPNWKKQSQRFLDAVERADLVSTSPSRTQNRATEIAPPHTADDLFENAPDTDWTLAANREWVGVHIEKARNAVQETIPLQIAGEFLTDGVRAVGADPSRPGIAAYYYTVADEDHVDRAIVSAQAALAAWAARPRAERRDLLLRCADELARQRGHLISAAMLDGGKAVQEIDPEVSEAIDFANYYARAYDDHSAWDGATSFPLGVVTIASPWNFPVAIPCGGILAALMAGNTVIFKPATDTVLCGWRLANILWKAGIPKNVLQFITPARAAATQLVVDPRIAAVVLTGASETAEKFLSLRPDLRLFAETGGKNAIIVTANADREQAVKDIVKSAFGHGGQKCSATSLLVLEAEVHDDPGFLRQLSDAVASLRIGPAWNTVNTMTALIHPPDATLQRALTNLDDGETWVLEPRELEGNPALWSPGIKRGVKPGSWFHHTECFGPVLGIMRADNLAHAIEIVNSVKYGLTSGLHSLDEREIALWREKIEAGNLYINRSTTGAIVRRQPFGGWKASVYGPGAKAGGPNYVAQFSHWTSSALGGHELPENTAEISPSIARVLEQLKGWLGASSKEAKILDVVAGNYAWAHATEFAVEHDPSRVLGEHNHFRYRLQDRVVIRADLDTPQIDIALALLAAHIVGITAALSLRNEGQLPPSSLVEDIVIEPDAGLAERIKDKAFTRYTVVRQLCDASEELLRTVNGAHFSCITGRPVTNGRLELRALYREQSVSHSYHRYGNIIPAPVARETPK